MKKIGFEKSALIQIHHDSLYYSFIKVYIIQCSNSYISMAHAEWVCLYICNTLVSINGYTTYKVNSLVVWIYHYKNAVVFFVILWFEIHRMLQNEIIVLFYTTILFLWNFMPKAQYSCEGLNFINPSSMIVT